MALKSRKEFKTASTVKIIDEFNNVVSWQITNGENIDVSTNAYIDAEGFGIFLGGEDGLVKVDLINGGTITFNGIGNTIYPMKCTKVYPGADTTATNIIAYR
jgi:hypothetical protein